MNKYIKGITILNFELNMNTLIFDKKTCKKTTDIIDILLVRVFFGVLHFL